MADHPALYIMAHLAEVLHPVRAKCDQAWATRTWLHTLHPIVGGGVTPQQIHQHRTTILQGAHAEHHMIKTEAV